MRKCAGISLVEMMIAITIIAVLASVAVPSYRSVTTRNRISSEIGALMGDFQYARSESVRQGLTVVVCTIADPNANPPTCGASSSWQNGWIVFSDVGGSGAYDPTKGDVLLRQQQPFAGGAVSDTVVATPSISSVSFNREGFSAVANAESFAFHDYQNTPNYSRCISLSVVGFLALATPGTAGCV
jgi:type IV fimbrial biogenesis protein FimT